MNEDPQIEYLAFLGGVTYDQMADSIAATCEALRAASWSMAELTPGLTFDDRRWVSQMGDAPYLTPARFSERWLALLRR